MVKHKLVKSEHVHAKVHGVGAFGKFNAWLAVKITNSVGTMVCAYIFTVIALIGLPAAIGQVSSQGPLPLVQWTAQTLIQLVLLSVILVGQRVISESQDARAETDHATLGAIHGLAAEIKGINEKQTEILTNQNAILTELQPTIPPAPTKTTKKVRK